MVTTHWGRRLSFLVDTNVLIAGDPRTDIEIEPLADDVAELFRSIREGGHDLLVHPATIVDLDRDPDDARRRARRVEWAKFPPLPRPPDVPEEWRVSGSWSPGDNDHVDLLLLAAIDAHAASFLVSQDAGLRRRADRFDLGDRVLSVSQALDHVRRLAGRSTRPPPALDSILAHELDPQDPMFDSLREAYFPKFDDWFDRARQERRPAFVMRTDGRLTALALLKREPDGNDAGLAGTVLKVSTFKVARWAEGGRRGELLLKAIFTMANTEAFDGIYLTVFADQHPTLVGLLKRFGFSERAWRTGRGEHVLAKRLATQVGLGRDVPDDALTFHTVFGPPALHPSLGALFLVPIRPALSHRLFPDASAQELLIEPESSGHGILKAYLSNAVVRGIRPGDILAFYESSSGRAGGRGVFAVGVTEDATDSGSATEIAEIVGTRTVYSFDEIEQLAQNRAILALRFRHDRNLSASVDLNELLQHGVLIGPPQSITRVREEGASWFRSRLLQ